MATKKRSSKHAIILPDQLRIYMTVKMQMAKMDGVAFAEKIGFSHQTVYAVMNGRRSPPEDMLKQLGLEIAYKIPGTAEVLSPKELRLFVTVKMQMSGLDIKGYADKLKEQHKTMYAVLAGARFPSKNLIKKLELEKVYRILPEGGAKRGSDDPK